MVHLKEIQWKDGVISCRYSPEHTEQYGYIEVDATSWAFVHKDVSITDSQDERYAGLAKTKLWLLSDENASLPQEAWGIFW